MTPKPQPNENRLIVALDFDSLPRALEMARKLVPLGVMFKIGSQLYTTDGPRAVAEIAALGAGIFLDLKFHDIPNTVAGAVLSASGLPGIRMINVHALGGRAMLEAAVQAVHAGQPLGQDRPKLLAVTILTSMADKDMREVGIAGRAQSRVVALARLARKAGVDGVVASVREARAIRKACGRDFLIVTLGVRPAAKLSSGRAAVKTQDDHARVGTPAEALRAGADYVGVGRPILAAPDPHAAAVAILRELADA